MARKCAIFMMGDECVIGIREGRGYWFIKEYSESVSGGMKWTGNKNDALKMPVDSAKGIMAKEGVKRYDVFD